MDERGVEAQDRVRSLCLGAPAVRDVAGRADQVVLETEVDHVLHVGTHLVRVQDRMVLGRGRQRAQGHGLLDVAGLHVVEVDGDGSVGLTLLGGTGHAGGHGIHGRGQGLDTLDAARALEHGLPDHHHVGDLVAVQGLGVAQVDDVVGAVLVAVATVQDDEGLGRPATEGLQVGILLAGEQGRAGHGIQVLEHVALVVLVHGAVQGVAAPEQVLGHGELGALDRHAGEAGPVADGLLDQDLVRAVGPRGREHGHGGVAHALLALEGHGHGVGVGDGDRVGRACGVDTEAGHVVQALQDHVNAVLDLELALPAIADVDVVEGVGGGEGGPGGVEAPGELEVRGAVGGLDRGEQDLGGRRGGVRGVVGDGRVLDLDVARGHQQAEGHQGDQGVTHGVSPSRG